MITQGKWLVMGNQRNGHFDFVLPLAKDEDFQDNARLIAAAPDLLEACKAIMQAEVTPNADVMEISTKTFIRCVCAIAKAESEV